MYICTKLKDKGNMEKVFINAREASEVLGVKENTIYQYTSKGLLPRYKKHGRIYFIKQEIIEWVKAGKVESPRHHVGAN